MLHNVILKGIAYAVQTTVSPSSSYANVNADAMQTVHPLTSSPCGFQLDLITHISKLPTTDYRAATKATERTALPETLRHLVLLHVFLLYLLLRPVHPAVDLLVMLFHILRGTALIWWVLVEDLWLRTVRCLLVRVRALLERGACW